MTEVWGKASLLRKNKQHELELGSSAGVNVTHIYRWGNTRHLASPKPLHYSSPLGAPVNRLMSSIDRTGLPCT